MLDKLFPIEHVKKIEDVDYERLVKSGYTTFLFDYDFTLAPWKTLNIDKEAERIFQRLREMGARVYIVTNAKEDRVGHLRDRFPWMRIYWNMRKPFLKRISEMLKREGIDPERCVIIGDLFITDILIGNRLGMYTVMVNPRLYETRELYKWIVGGLSIAFYRTVFFVFGWFFRLSSLISPNEWVESVGEVDYSKLLEHGFETFVFDFDNTLAPWRSNEIPDSHLEILERLLGSGAKVIVASNGKREIELPVPAIWRSGKPLGFKIKRKLREMGADFKKTVVIGDQLFTDVLFGNTIGAYTIKVQPLRKEEALITKMNRLLEKMFSRLLVEKPSLTSQNGE